MASALRHFLERAVAERLPTFETWFPPLFDWRALCRDLPTMAARHGIQMDADGEAARRLEQTGRTVFPAAHLLALAVLSAGAGATADPERLLARLTRKPDEEVEDVLEPLYADALGPAEAALVEGEHPGGDVGRAAGLAAAVWPAVEGVLARDEADFFGRVGPAEDLLWGVARLAVVAAALRWMAADAVAEDWPALVTGGDGA